MVSQKDAVYNSIIAVLNENNIEIPESGVKNLLNKDLKIAVASIIRVGIEMGDIPFNGDVGNIDRYISGLIANWVNKDPRLNGNKKYRVSSRTSGNPSLDEAMKLYGVVKGTFLEAQVSTVISSMKRKQSIDVEYIPINLRELIR